MLKQDIRKQVAETVITAMETSGADWNKSWGGSLPTSKATNKAYNGINHLLLSIYQTKYNYSSHEWGTYKQWKENGGTVRKGEKGKLVVFYKTIDRKLTPEEIAAEQKGEKIFNKTIPILKHFVVFNADQVDGYVSPTIQGNKWQADTLADKLASDVNAKVNYSHNGQCYYHPSSDTITMTDIKYFNCKESYACTLLHELTHWTKGKAQNLERDYGKSKFGNQAYAIEELVAELGAAMLAGQLGISKTPRKDHAEYLNNWIQAIKDNNDIIFKAAAAADKASKYLLDKQAKATMKKAA
jgi:antirestriction protein ArdC